MGETRLWAASGEIRAPRRSGAEARELLQATANPPEVHLFPRSDGPGSSQDLPQFAAMGHRLPCTPCDFADPAWAWSRGCLRTPGACIDGAPIRFRAVPAADPEATEYYSPDFHQAPLSLNGEVPGRPEYFVNNILHQSGLAGVRIEAEAMPAIYRGTGLGGSNLAHVAAMLLGSALAGIDLDQGQLYVTATQLENQFGVRPAGDGEIGYGVSMTGGQEALAALQGGFYDNVHLPWFNGPFSVVSRPLLQPGDYAEAAAHLLLVNIGRRRAKGVTSSGINNCWMGQWRSSSGAAAHAAKPELAYRAAEALRLKAWDGYAAAVREYRQLRAELCADYLAGQEELAGWCQELAAEYFPLGAGTGTCLVVAEQAAAIDEIGGRIEASSNPETGRTQVPFRIRQQGFACLHFEENGLLPPAGPRIL